MEYKSNKFCAQLLSGAAILSMVGVAHAETVQYTIPPQSLGQALRAFGAQSGHPMLVDMKLVDEKKSPGVVAVADPETALSKLLVGTGLSYRRDGEVFTVILANSEPRTLPRSMRTVVAEAAETVSGSAVEGLVVTAQKRRENIQDVPIAISAFTQDKLEVSQIAGGPDLMTQVPNMTFTKTNFSGYSIQIRGIGTQAISATTDPAVSVSHNNTAFIRNRFFEQEFYDLERVEVLRGPQGTLYGRNATAGVVNLITAKPSFDYETKASVDLGNFESRRFEGMVNVPLSEDKAALRFAGAWTERQGYATNQLSGEPIDGRDLWSTRLSLRLSPTDNIDANIIWEHFQEEDDRLRSGKQLCHKHVITEVGGVPVTFTQQLPDAGQAGGVGNVQATFSQGCIRESLYSPNSFETVNGLSVPYYGPLGAIFLPTARYDPYESTVQSQDLRVIESSIDPKYRANSDIAEVQLSIDVSDGLTLTSETAYSADTVYSLQDFNRFNTAPGAWEQPSPPGSFGSRDGVLLPGPDGGIFCDPQLGCSDRLIAVDLSTAESRTFSQEFRLSSNYDGRFNFSFGANFLRYDTEDKYYVFINSLSLISAISPFGTGFRLTPYVPNVTDNRECLKDGPLQGDPDKVYGVASCTYLDPNPIEHVNDQGHNYFLSKNPYKLISYALFGEAYFNITENLKLTAGLRVTKDKKDAPRIPSWTLAEQTVGYPVAEVIKQEWTEPTGRLAIDWKPDFAFTDDTLFYASYARGYKAGGTNPPKFTYVFYSGADVVQDAADQSATRPKTFAPEFVNALEVGTKNTFLDGRLTANIAGFYYDYEGYQISEIVDRSAFNRNFDATVWGLEYEFDWQALENLRFGLKVGYEKTRIADGERAVDLMDRTAGHEGWLVVRPFPTFASSCILPDYIYAHDGIVTGVGGVNGGNANGGCEAAYIMGIDPLTQLPYVPNPTVGSYPLNLHTNYPGFDPTTAPNHGEGFFKELGGNELPNAPNYTVTLTGDYTLPMGEDWTATLHTDLYYQSEAWWRVFNDHEYNKLDAYFTANLALILRNEDSGWNIMGYIKNVTDETAITGAFLNSDDTGLTTNVFLTEPRLYGVRVSKNWSGIPFWKQGAGESAPHDPSKPYLFTLELDGGPQYHGAPYDTLQPGFIGAFAPTLDHTSAQNQDLDTGDARSIKLTYAVPDSKTSVSVGMRFGKSNGYAKFLDSEIGDSGCLFYASSCFGTGVLNGTNYVDENVHDHDEYTLVDFSIGRDVGLGLLSKSVLWAGLRYAEFKSRTEVEFDGIPDWDIAEEKAWSKYDSTHHRYEAELASERKFKGFGPTLGWEAAQRLYGGDTSHIDLEWALQGGVLFGKQKTSATGEERGKFFEGPKYYGYLLNRQIGPTAVTQIAEKRSQSVTVLTAAGSLGLSYTLDRVSVGAGYRWERYFDVLDAGYSAEKQYDRTFDGPYFKVAVGFGG